MAQEHEERVAELQQELSDRLSALALVPETDPRHPGMCEEAFDAADALIAYEDDLPALLEAGPHRLTRLLVTWSGVVTALAGAGTGLAVGLGARSLWWFLPALVLLAVGVRVAATSVHPPGGPHLRQRPAPLLALLAAVLAGLAVVAGPAWLLVPSALAAATAVRELPRRSPERAR